MQFQSNILVACGLATIWRVVRITRVFYTPEVVPTQNAIDAKKCEQKIGPYAETLKKVLTSEYPRCSFCTHFLRAMACHSMSQNIKGNQTKLQNEKPNR